MMRFKTTCLCLLTSLLLFLSFPVFNQQFFAWIGFIPLLLAIEDKTKRQAFWLSYLSGFVFFISTLYWLVHVTLTGLIILCLYLAYYFAFFGYFFVGFKKKISNFNFLTIIFLSSVWVISEYIRSYLFSGFPWALLGYSQYLNIGLIQVADITGSFGLSFLVVFVNLSVLQIIKLIYKKEFKTTVRILLVLLLVFVAIYGYGYYAINKYSAISKEAVKVTLIQGNIPQENKWAEIFRDKIKQIYFGLTCESSIDDSDLIIWPETAYPDYFPDRDRTAFGPLVSLVRQIQKPILFGAVLEEENKYFNGAILIPLDLSQIVFYRKIHLVPFGEYLPLRRYLPFLEKVVPIEDFDAGNEFVVFTTKNRKKESVSFGVVICFEDTIFDLARQFRLKGADFLVNITNDAWFKKTSSPYQHLQASVFRAVENRIYMLRAANTGITCIIDNCGRVLERVRDKVGRDIFVGGHVSGEVKKQDSISFYSRFGDIFVLVCGLYILLFAIFSRGMWLYAPKSNRRGFTLIEVLVATVIFMLVIGMIYTIFMGTMNYWKRGYGLASRQQAARTLFSRMTSNISSIFLSTSRGIYCFGSKEKLYFVSTSPKSSEGDLSEMGYEFNPSDNTILYTHQEKADFDFNTFDSRNVIAIKILGLTFSYLDKNGNWSDNWDSRVGGQQEKLPPQAIKINFAIENTDYPDNKEIFETIVELPIRSKYQ